MNSPWRRHHFPRRAALTAGFEAFAAARHSGREDALAPFCRVPVVALAQGKLQALTLLVERVGTRGTPVLGVVHDESLSPLLGQDLPSCNEECGLIVLP